MVCLLLDKKGRNMIRDTKYIVIKNIKDTKTTLINLMIFTLLENINNLVSLKISTYIYIYIYILNITV